MYEVEFKVEITEAEAQNLFAFFKQGGFVDHGFKTQSDHYIEVSFQADGWFNFTRYRSEDGKYISTEKTWEEHDGQRVHKEVESEVAEEDFTNEVFANPNAVSIEKNRRSFSGVWEDLNIHIDMDIVKFDHSPDIRYFIEAETITDNKSSYAKLKEKMKEVIEKALGREVAEAPNMFKLAYLKL